MSNNLDHKDVQIHQTALIDKSAKIGTGSKIGPFSIIEAGVTIGKNCTLHSNVHVCSNTVIGDSNEIFPFCSLGNSPQEKGYTKPVGNVIIGNRNSIREYTTIQQPTIDKGTTSIGDDCFLMLGSHIGHDSKVGDNVIFVNHATLAGHVTIGNNCYLSAFSTVVQFCSMGSYVMASPYTKVAQDVPPYLMIQEHPAKAHGLNLVGMKRGGIGPEARKQVKDIFKIMFTKRHSTTVSLQLIEKNILDVINKDSEEFKVAMNFFTFAQNSKKGIIASCYS